MTARVNSKVINKAEEARCLKNIPQQLQDAERVTHDVKAVLMCEHLRSVTFCLQLQDYMALNTLERNVAFRSILV